MGAEQPFLYDPPSQNGYPHRHFNPKAASQASFERPTPRPKHEGPLIDFNKHPDSYVIVPYGNLNAKPMSPRTRKRVSYLRWTQLLFRLLELTGAVGMLVCAICVRQVDDTMGWTLRIPPGVAIIHCVYAIYHLSRNPSRRMPGSSASYMLFATIADTSIVSFFVFTALISNTQYTKHVGRQWKSVFDDPVADDKIIHAIFLFGIVNGALFLISLCISLCLAIVFHKITKLPPDMNPLEDNLTSRHKRNKSSMVEKRSSEASSTSTLAGPTEPNRSSLAQEPFIPPPRTVPFLHTRSESTEDFNVYPSSPYSKRNSRADLPSQVSLYESQRSSHVDITRSSGLGSPTKRPTYPAESTPPPNRCSRGSLANDNWYAYFNHEEPTANENLVRAVSNVSSMKDYELRMANDITDHNTVQSQRPLHDVPHPLEAHPPTPPPRSSQTMTGLQAGSSSSPSRIDSIKVKLYGDLKSATPPVMGTYVDLPLANKSNTRVISNSGADYNGRGSAGKREVSGKVAEEGRGGGAWARFRKVSGR